MWCLFAGVLRKSGHFLVSAIWWKCDVSGAYFSPATVGCDTHQGQETFGLAVAILRLLADCCQDF